MAEQLAQSWPEERMAREVERLLAVNPAYGNLDEHTRHTLTESLLAVTRALESGAPGAPVDRSLAGVDDLRQRLAAGTGGSTDGSAPAPAPAQASPTPAGSATTPGSSTAPGSSPTSTTGRAGDVARATLNAIDFPEFVAGLIQGTFHAIVDASIQQMEAYAELLKNVAVSVDRFMNDNISEQSARDHLADQYDSVFSRDTSSGQPRLVVKQDASELPSFLKDLGLNSVDDLDNETVDNVVVPATRRSMAETRQQTLATMVLMGINRVVVDDGEINAKLQFHVDASESTKIKFDQNKTTNGQISGRAGRNPFGATAILVNTVNLNAQSALNVRADLTGEVKVKFRSDYMPLERFADSAAIQLINQNARVPQPLPAPASAPANAPAATPPAAATTPPPAPPNPAPAPAAPPANQPAAQSLSNGKADPWMRA